jgi:hypothetical protein
MSVCQSGKFDESGTAEGSLLPMLLLRGDGLEVLKLVEVERPTSGPGKVLVRVKAAPTRVCRSSRSNPFR